MRIAIGIDPGATTGVAVWGEHGLAYHAQDTAPKALNWLLRWISSARPLDIACVAIESAWMGKGPGASLSVAKSAGFCIGALWCSGVLVVPSAPLLWEPKPSEWRKVHGFPSKRKPAEEAALAFATAHIGHELLKKQVHEAEAVCLASAAWEHAMVKA